MVENVQVNLRSQWELGPKIALGDKMLKKITDFNCILGEGPVWDAEKRKLWWIDIKGKKIHSFSNNGKIDTITCEGQVGCLGLWDKNHLIVAEETGIFKLNLKEKDFVRFGKIKPEGETLRYNDGKIGPDGKFWFGSLDDIAFPPIGSLYSIDTTGTSKRHLDNICCSNGIGWTLDGTRMFYTDSKRRVIWSFDFNKIEGTISNRQSFAEIVGEQVPDGLAVDIEGNVWSAMWDGWALIKFDPSGNEIDRISVPVPRPTSCAFGGDDMKTLFITSASIDLDGVLLSEAPDSGALFSIAVDVQGVPVGSFGL